MKIQMFKLFNIWYGTQMAYENRIRIKMQPTFEYWILKS